MMRLNEAPVDVPAQISRHAPSPDHLPTGGTVAVLKAAI
jgi:hypothetical protein